MANSFWIVLVIAAVATAQVALADYPMCNPPRRPDYGGYSPHMANYTVGSRIMFHCDKGYKLHGASWTECKWDKASYWVNPPPVCTSADDPKSEVHQLPKRATTCPRLSAPRFGKLRVNGYTPGSKANYSCDFGYKLYGNRQRKCKPNGRWSGRAPACRPA